MPSDASILTDLPVIGALPDALSGQYLVAGEGTVHAVSIRAGRAASYRARSISMDASNVVGFGSSVLAFGDGALAYELDGGLGTVRRVDLAGASRCLNAHPKVDPITGELHLLTSAADPSQTHVTVSPGGLTRTIRSIDNAPSTIRQLEVTRDDVVFLADGFVGVTARTGVNANATWFEMDRDACHLATAHTQGETVVAYATGPSLARWTLHRRAKTIDHQVLDATSQTFASSNRRLLGTSHRFLWTVGSGAAHKHDLITETRGSHEFGSGRHPGALVFVADPDRSRAEDGGWLVGFVHGETAHEIDLVVLDAQAIERPAIAVLHIPRRVPSGAHGRWIPTVRI